MVPVRQGKWGVLTHRVGANGRTAGTDPRDFDQKRRISS